MYNALRQMKSMTTFPGTKQHQALLKCIVEHYQDDPRVLALIVFGSLGHGNWDEYSDMNVIAGDDTCKNISNELQRLCTYFTSVNERAAIVLPEDDEGDIVLETLLQLSIRYHPLAQTSPNIVDSMLVLAGSLDEAEIAAAGNGNRAGEAQPIGSLLDRCVRCAVVANVEIQRKHFWAANEILQRMRTLLMDIFARTHGGYRGYQFFDIRAEKRLQQRLRAALPTFAGHALQQSFKQTLDILEGDLQELSAGQVALSEAQKLILERVRQQIDSAGH